MEGYNHEDYAWSLKAFGTPRNLVHCGGWVLERPTPFGQYINSMGLYPFFVCDDWSKLPKDLSELCGEVISVSLVTDPFGEFELAMLQDCFQDVCKPFKPHYVVDLSIPMDEVGGKRRRKHANRALKKVDIDVIDDPLEYIDDWIDLYGVLIQKHGIQGIRSFSREAFTSQFQIPDCKMIQARYQGKVVGAQVYLVQDDVVHAHLGACTQEGYDLDATYALDYFSFQYFKDKARWVDLGGGIGVSSDGSDGLSQYKQGWASHTRQTYFCGLVLDREQYDDLVKKGNISPTEYFPAYRSGEFG